MAPLHEPRCCTGTEHPTIKGVLVVVLRPAPTHLPTVQGVAAAAVTAQRGEAIPEHYMYLVIPEAFHIIYFFIYRQNYVLVSDSNLCVL